MGSRAPVPRGSERTASPNIPERHLENQSSLNLFRIWPALCSSAEPIQLHFIGLPPP
jgi:hypothetical protein